MKPVSFEGDSLAALQAFPDAPRREAGFQLDRAQRGLMPDDCKPLAMVGRSVYEIRIQDRGGAFRVIYIAKLADAVHVLHAFQKKTQQTSKADIDLARKRLNDLLRR